VMLEEQQVSIDLDPDAPEVNIKGDLGSVHARRLLQSLLHAEVAQPVRAVA
jgi:hypothetical protein